MAGSVWKRWFGRPKLQVSWRAAADGLRFVARARGIGALPLPMRDWEVPPQVRTRLQQEPQAPAALVLDDLWGDGLLEAAGDGTYRLAYERYHRLPDHDRTLLGLPEAVGVHCEATCRSYPGAAGFRIKVACHDAERGPLDMQATRHGCVFVCGERELVVVPPEVGALYDEAESVPAAGASQEEQMRYLARVQQAARAAGAEMDDFLLQEEYVFPRAVSLDVALGGPEELHLRPRLETEAAPDTAPDAALAEHLRELERARSPLPVSRPAEAGGTTGKRRRVVLTPRQQQVISRTNERPPIQGANVPAFLDNPAAFLPDDLLDALDFAEFSRRVRGLRVRRYNARPYVVLRDAGGGWLDVECGVSVQAASPEAVDDDGSAPPALTPEAYAELAAMARQQGTDRVLHDGAWIKVDPSAADELARLRGAVATAAPPGGAGRLPPDRQRLVLDVIDNLAALEYRLETAGTGPTDGVTLLSAAPNLAAHKLPPGFAGELRPFQKLGYDWMIHLAERHLGGLLADDMGLGKTVQSIAFLAHLAAHDALTPSLLVVPATLQDNWCEEIRSFAPALAGGIRRHGGPHRARSPELFAPVPLTLTTYETLARDQQVLARVDWKVVLCDEAQKVKNPTTLGTESVKALKARHRLALSGTPVENGLSELWCIMDFVQPGRLGSWAEFRERFERPIVQDGTDRPAHVERLRRQMDPLLLRREKRQVLPDLPPRHEHIHRPPLSPEQRRLYAGVVAAAREGGGNPLGAIQRLIQLCSHPGLVTGSDGATREPAADACAKLETALEILARVRAAGEKAVVFTCYRAMQSILKRAIAARLGICAGAIDGDVAIGNRQGIVRRFNDTSGFDVLILSPKAAGVGLNVVGANHVLHYTRLWNPAQEEQATSRVHRIGQTLPVHVYQLVVSDDRFKTAEVRLAELLESKRRLAGDILRPAGALQIREEELRDCLDAVVNG